MKRNRRKFLKRVLAGATLAAVGGGIWVKTSQRRSARYLRMMFADAKRGVQPAPVKPDPTTWDANRITICWLGHATVLINFYGFTILTDPVLGKRCGVDLGVGTVGPKRYVSPALRVDQLPPIDLLLLSHAHMDHMDIATLDDIPLPSTTITAKETGEIIQGTKARSPRELSWKDKVKVKGRSGELHVRAAEVKHWGRRWPNDINRGYNGYILEREGRKLLFGGDTANTTLFKELRGEGPFEAAIMPIGAYRPWIRNHCTPEEAVEMADAAGAKYIVPIHHQTFRLSEEPMTEPIERLLAALQKEQGRVALQKVGEHFVCPA